MSLLELSFFIRFSELNPGADAPYLVATSISSSNKYIGRSGLAPSCINIKSSSSTSSLSFKLAKPWYSLWCLVFPPTATPISFFGFVSSITLFVLSQSSSRTTNNIESTFSD